MRRAIAALLVLAAVWFVAFAYFSYQFAISTEPLSENLGPDSRQVAGQLAIFELGEAAFMLVLAVLAWLRQIYAIVVAAVCALVSLPPDMVSPFLLIPLPLPMWTLPFLPAVLSIPILVLAGTVLVRARSRAAVQRPGVKRRRAVAVLLFLGSAGPLFSVWYLLSNLEEPVDLGSVAFAVVGALAIVVALLLGILVWRGVNAAIYAAAVFAVVSVIADAAFALAVIPTDQTGFIGLFAVATPPFGPSLPEAIPILVLCLTLILRRRRTAQPSNSPA